MEQPIGPRITGLEHKADEIKKAVDRMTHTNHSGSQNVNSITLNAGGIALWAALTACMVMFGINMFLAAALLDHSRKIDDLNHYLNAIYMMAPELKPKEKQ